MLCCVIIGYVLNDDFEGYNPNFTNYRTHIEKDIMWQKSMEVMKGRYKIVDGKDIYLIT